MVVRRKTTHLTVLKHLNSVKSEKMSQPDLASWQKYSIFLTDLANVKIESDRRSQILSGTAEETRRFFSHFISSNKTSRFLDALGFQPLMCSFKAYIFHLHFFRISFVFSD